MFVQLSLKAAATQFGLKVNPMTFSATVAVSSGFVDAK